MYTQSSPFQKKSKIKGGGTKKVCLPAFILDFFWNGELCVYIIFYNQSC